MTFDDLKDAVCGETVLVDQFETHRYFVGLVKDKLLTSTYSTDELYAWEELSIKKWTIKKENKKYWYWDFKDNAGNWTTSSYKCDESFHLTGGSLHCGLNDAKEKTKVESSLLEI